MYICKCLECYVIYIMKQRLEQFLQAENISKAQFADSIRVARAGISHIMAGRNNPSYEFIVNTMQSYPDLNIEWLLTGRGRMYKSSEDRTPQAEPTSLFNISAHTQADAQISDSSTQPSSIPTSRQVLPSPGQGKRIIILYDDGTYEEFC